MKFDSVLLMTPQAPSVTAFVTRRGFNACPYAGAPDSEATLGKTLIAAHLGIPEERVIIPTQTHSSRVAAVGDDLQGVDALVTDKRKVALCINTADCLPLILADTEAGVIGAAHCGWRGTVAEIAVGTVEKMVSLGANPRRIIAVMGPCICPKCFEVGDEVASQFPEDCIIRKPGLKPHVDLAKAVTNQLMSAGINPKNITPPPACSMHTDQFYSVRRQGRDLTKRTLTAIMLN